MSKLETHTPYVSVVLMVDSQRQRAERALKSLLDQDGLEAAEILILDLAVDRFPPLKGSDHPGVRIIQSPAPLAFNDLRSYAVPLARGEVVAYLEDHAVAVPGWLQTLIKDFRAGHAGVGGEPGVLNPGVGISDIVSIMNYAPFMPVPTPRLTRLLPGHNSAYRRDVLLSFGDQLPALMSSEVLLNWRMVAQGHTLLLDRGAKFLHFNEQTLRMIAGGYYYWNLSFGAARAMVFGWPWWRRVLQLLAVPLVPIVRYFKFFIYLFRHDRSRLPTLVRFTGVFLCAQAAAGYGLGVGALFGAGDADIRFRDYELNYDRNPVH